MKLAKDIRAILSLGISVACGLALSQSPRLQAEETKVEKVQNKTDEVVKDTKQEVRQTKKKIRDKTGNDDLGQDLKDGARNAKDEIKYQAKKAKRKID
jgi:apolipoprotein N-acyltransferase